MAAFDCSVFSVKLPKISPPRPFSSFPVHIGAGKLENTPKNAHKTNNGGGFEFSGALPKTAHAPENSPPIEIVFRDIGKNDYSDTQEAVANAEFSGFPGAAGKLGKLIIDFGFKSTSV